MAAAKKAAAPKPQAKEDPAAQPDAAPSGESAYQVTGALVQARVGEKVLHFSFGAILPAGVHSEDLANLKSLGFVREVKA